MKSKSLSIVIIILGLVCSLLMATIIVLLFLKPNNDQLPQNSDENVASDNDDYNLESSNLVGQSFDIGDTFSMGKWYSVEKNESTITFVKNGMDIEWTVLDKDGDNYFIISSLAIDSYYSEDYYESGPWSECGERDFLNNIFYEEAFSNAEKSLIQLTRVKDYENPSDGVSVGSATNDYVFLLSTREIEKYYPEKESRICSCTVYAGESIDCCNECSWWLRTPSTDFSSGLGGYQFYFVDSDGSIGGKSSRTYIGHCLRPVMWISLENNNKQVNLEKEYSVGDIVEFGICPSKYNTTENEKINWQVVKKENNNYLLISTHVFRGFCSGQSDLDCYYASWKTCPLRTELNHYFYNNAFTESEKEFIKPAQVIPDHNSNGDVSQVNSTIDYIFAPSILEINEWFPDNSSRICKDAANESSTYWLRTFGYSSLSGSKSLTFVMLDGSVSTEGSSISVGGYICGIRPCMWISLDSIQ